MTPIISLNIMNQFWLLRKTLLQNGLRLSVFFVLSLALCPPILSQQTVAEEIDTTVVAAIIAEGINNSKVMETLGWLTDVYGPRLTGSRNFKKAAEWARQRLESWGLENSHLEEWGPFGRGWELKRHFLHIIEPQSFPAISYPTAWSPGTKGTVKAEFIHLDAATDSALETYRGKLRGKFVLFDAPRELNAQFEPLARRRTDSQLLELANTSPGPATARRPADRRDEALLRYNKFLLCQKEGAAAIFRISDMDGGTIRVMGATVPAHPDTPWTRRPRAYDSHTPKILPQIVLATEHYNRLVRLLEKNIKVLAELHVEVEFTPEQPGYNVIAELPGTDLRDELVIIGGHLDSWHGATGTTDNAAGSAVAMEAIRILRALDLKPRRTIRVALWGGEEQGWLGSRAHVQKHFAQRELSFDDSVTFVSHKPLADKFSVYFNLDNGTGKIRGVYMQGNEAVRPIFRAWLGPFATMGASTLTPASTGGTDHIPFNEVGLPGFQFIQDPIEYGTRTWHTTMDVLDRAQEEDLKQAAIIMASFAYHAAMRDERIPRRTIEAEIVRMSE